MGLVKAKCAEHIQNGGTDFWFPEKGPAYSDYKKHVLAAKTICASCPIRETCLENVLSMRPFPSRGVWAGFTLSELSRFKYSRRLL